MSYTNVICSHLITEETTGWYLFTGAEALAINYSVIRYLRRPSARLCPSSKRPDRITRMRNRPVRCKPAICKRVFLTWQWAARSTDSSPPSSEGRALLWVQLGPEDHSGGGWELSSSDGSSDSWNDCSHSNGLGSLANILSKHPVLILSRCFLGVCFFLFVWGFFYCVFFF